MPRRDAVRRRQKNCVDCKVTPAARVSASRAPVCCRSDGRSAARSPRSAAAVAEDPSRDRVIAVRSSRCGLRRAPGGRGLRVRPASAGGDRGRDARAPSASTTDARRRPTPRPDAPLKLTFDRGSSRSTTRRACGSSSTSCARSTRRTTPHPTSSQSRCRIVNSPTLRQEAADQIVAMFAAYTAETGNQMQAQSAYRSYGVQVSVYNGWVDSLGQAGADQTSARPGHSEHQTGLAMDISAVPATCARSTSASPTPTRASGWRPTRTSGDSSCATRTG